MTTTDSTRRLALAALGLSAVNTAVLVYWLVVGVGGPAAPVVGTTSTVAAPLVGATSAAPVPPGPGSGPGPGSAPHWEPVADAAGLGGPYLRWYLDKTIAILQGVAVAKGGSIDDVDVDEQRHHAAVASGSVASEASTELLSSLRGQFAAAGLPFPEPGTDPEQLEMLVRQYPSPAVATGPGGQAGQGGGGAVPDGSTVRGIPEREILRSYFAVTTERVLAAARQKGVDVTPLMPTDVEVAAAVGSGDRASPEFRRVLDRLREAHEAAGIPMPDAGIE